jgi:hypothetical protein
VNKLFQNFGSKTAKHERYSVYKKHTLAKSSFLVVSIFNMHARRPIRPHMAIKPKIEVSAGGKAVIRLSL